MLYWFRMKSKYKKVFAQLQKGKKMFGALKTVEDHNLFASFGLVDGLNEKELETVNGGLFIPSITIEPTCTFTIETTCTLNTGTNGDNNNTGHGSGSGNNNGNGNGSGNSSGSSGPNSSSSSS